MRNILFRAKRKDNGEWVYGYYAFTCVKRNNDPFCLNNYIREPFIITTDGEAHKVIPETVGQYTGLTDKNGKKIFEGDIVRHYNNSLEEYDVGVIYWDFDFVGWRRTSTGGFHKIPNNTYKLSTSCDYEVVGNIHDNPELLGGNEKI